MIRLDNLTINYKNEKVLINNINIYIQAGYLVSITGSPASGKTSLFKVIGLQEKANQGTLYILGKNINKLNRFEITQLHNEISLVNENNDLIPNLSVTLTLASRIVNPILPPADKLIELVPKSK